MYSKKEAAVATEEDMVDAAVTMIVVDTAAAVVVATMTEVVAGKLNTMGGRIITECVSLQLMDKI